MRCGAFHRVEGTLCLARHGQAALSGSKTKAPGFAGGYLLRFRHVISGSLALASLNHTCRNLVPTFPQRSPPSLLTTAACGGLRSTPDCRPRRAFLHLSYSYAAPCGPALLVTQCHNRTHAPQQTVLSLDNLVRPCNERRGHSEVERLRRNQVHNKIE